MDKELLQDVVQHQATQGLGCTKAQLETAYTLACSALWNDLFSDRTAPPLRGSAGTNLSAATLALDFLQERSGLLPDSDGACRLDFLQEGLLRVVAGQYEEGEAQGKIMQDNEKQDVLQSRRYGPTPLHPRYELLPPGLDGVRRVRLYPTPESYVIRFAKPFDRPVIDMDEESKEVLAVTPTGFSGHARHELFYRILANLALSLNEPQTGQLYEQKAQIQS